MKLRIHPRVFRVLTLLWAIAILLLSLLPIDGSGVPGTDKSKHFLAYFGLALGLLCGFASLPPSVDRDSKGTKLHRPAVVFAVLALSLLLGALVELLQPATGRHRDILDMAANAAGTAAGLLVWLCFQFWARKRRPPAQES